MENKVEANDPESRLVPTWIRSRLRYLRECTEFSQKSPIVVATTSLVALYTFLGEIIPYLDVPTFLLRFPKLPLTWAVIIFFLVALFLVLEGGYRTVEHEVRAHQSLKVKYDELNERHELASTVSSHDPRIIPEFEPMGSKSFSQHGNVRNRKIVLKNRGGGDAYRVQVQPLLLGAGQAHFSEISELESGDNKTASIDIRGSKGEDIGILSRGDLELLLEADWDRRGDLTLETITLPMKITYTDHKKRPFVTEANIRFQPGGTTEIGDYRFEKLERVDAAQWKDLASRFGTVSDSSVRADWFKEADGSESWRICGSHQEKNGEVKSLCMLAGSMLANSMNIFPDVSPAVRLQENPTWRWLGFLKERYGLSGLRTGYQTSNSQPGKEFPFYFGSVNNLASVSARACIESAATET